MPHEGSKATPDEAPPRPVWHHRFRWSLRAGRQTNARPGRIRQRGKGIAHQRGTHLAGAGRDGTPSRSSPCRAGGSASARPPRRRMRRCSLRPSPLETRSAVHGTGFRQLVVRLRRTVGTARACSDRSKGHHRITRSELPHLQQSAQMRQWPPCVTGASPCLPTPLDAHRGRRYRRRPRARHPPHRAPSTRPPHPAIPAVRVGRCEDEDSLKWSTCAS